jgi:NAD(P)-dependent dehydrogenase (short-subunit alcohol dehydrogenase family)
VDLELTGRRALVTGGSRGIGLAVGRALAAGAPTSRSSRARRCARRAGRRAGERRHDGAGRHRRGRIGRGGSGTSSRSSAASTSSSTPRRRPHGAVTDDDLEAEINVKVAATCAARVPSRR